MKRALLTIIVIGVVAAAIGIVRSNSDDSRAAKPSATNDSHVDVTRAFDRELTTDQIKQQAEQSLRAQADLAAKVKDASKAGSHTLVVTIREESPGDVWVVRKIGGKSACVTPPKTTATYVRVSYAGDAPSRLRTTVTPEEAQLLTSGACEAHLELFVPSVSTYKVAVVGTGQSKFDPVRIRRDGNSQKVTVVG